jgi:hypothetical protein
MRRVAPEQVKQTKSLINFDVMATSKLEKAVKKIKKDGFKRPDHKLKLGAIFNIEHWRGDELLREFQEENLCPDEFINYMLDVGLSDATQLTDWYCLIFNDNHTPAAGNTYATPGFTESTAYDETTRPAWVEAGVTSKVITNSASKATFTMTGVDTSIYGAAIVGGVHATDGDIDTKDDQAASPGVLGPEAQFTGGAVTGIVDDDVLKVYVTITGSDV